MQPIILIGYRGSGKTSVGKKLAAVRGVLFADSDDQIVKTAGMSIKEIFECEGEQRFRDRETEAIRKLLAEQIDVLSLGGGAVLREENQDLIKQASTQRIYLRCDPEELHHRIHRDPETSKTRPALTNLGGGLEEIKSLLQKRDPIYRTIATLTIDVTNLSVDDVVDRLKSV